MCPQQQRVKVAYYARVWAAIEGFLAPEGASPYPNEEDLVAPPDLFPSDDEINEILN